MRACKKILADDSSYQIWQSKYNLKCTEKFNFSLLEDAYFYYQCDLKEGYRRRFNDLLSIVKKEICINFFPAHRFKQGFLDVRNCITLKNISDSWDDPCENFISQSPNGHPTFVFKSEAVNAINHIFAHLRDQFARCHPTQHQILPEHVKKNLFKTWFVLGVMITFSFIEIEVIFHEKIVKRLHIFKRPQLQEESALIE